MAPVLAPTRLPREQSASRNPSRAFELRKHLYAEDHRTQLEIATQLGIDKSTLVPLLDRLERDGLIIRATSERDRRVRIPQATPGGIQVVQDVAIARDAAINDRLAAIPPADRANFHATLWRIVEGAATPD